MVKIYIFLFFFIFVFAFLSSSTFLFCYYSITSSSSASSAQQDAERAKFTVEKAEQEKLAAIIRAEGESTAATLISQALQESGQGLIELRRLEAAKDIAQTLAAARNITYLPGGEKGGNQSLLLNVGQ